MTSSVKPEVRNISQRCRRSISHGYMQHA